MNFVYISTVFGTYIYEQKNPPPPYHHKYNTKPLLTNAMCNEISKYVPFSNPTKSYKTPAIDGPKNAPRANDDDQMPDNNPYVCMSFGKPPSLQKK